MSEEQMNSYRLTSMEEPGDERMDSEYINPDNAARDIFGDWNNREAVLKAANYCND